MAEENIIYIVYDGECPFCRQYSKMVRIKKSVGQIILIDARDSSAILDELVEQGFDLDQGMVVKIADQYYHAAEAINILSILSSRSDLFNRINYRLFKSKTMATIFYPILRNYRNCALWLMNSQKINNPKNK